MPKNRFAKIAEQSRQKTNAELADELSRLTPLTEAQLTAMLPTKQDKENLARLMAIVKGSTDQNKKVAQLKSNIDEVGGVVVKLLGKIL
jgi:Lon protease-like protein